MYIYQFVSVPKKRLGIMTVNVGYGRAVQRLRLKSIGHVEHRSVYIVCMHEGVEVSLYCSA